VTDVLEYIEGGLLWFKGDKQSWSQQISVLDFLITIRDSFNATWIVEHWEWCSSWPYYCSQEIVSMLLIVYFQISYFLYLINMDITFPVQDIYSA